MYTDPKTPEANYDSQSGNEPAVAPAPPPDPAAKAAAVTALQNLQAQLLPSGKTFGTEVIALLLAMLADAPFTMKYPLPKTKLSQHVDLFGRGFTFTEALATDDLLVTETPD
jgi:hypothetical protein